MKVQNVYFVMPQLGGGGGERVISILLNNLNRKLFQPHLVILKKKGSNEFLKDLNEDITLHFFNVSKPIKYSFPIIIYRLLKLARRNKPDVLFLGSGQVNALLSPFLFLFPNKCKFLARESNIPSVFEKYGIIKLFYQRFYKNYDKIIVQSDDMFFDLNKNFSIPKVKLIKINNPVDVKYINSKLASTTEIELSKFKYNILATGRLNYQKGFDLLLKQFSKFSANYSNFHLTILGEGEEKETLTKLMNSLNLKEKVSFLGNVDNPYKYMEKADLFILSSRFEGFPNVVLEALYCGTPVLANNCLGGITEIIKPGFNGDIFFYDSLNFETKLVKTVNSKFESSKLRKDILERFSVEKKILDFEKVFENVCK